MPERPVLKARATLRLAALMAAAVAVLSLGAMALQYRLVATRLTEAQKVLLSSDLQALGALYDQRRIIALRQAIEYRSATPPKSTGQNGTGQNSSAQGGEMLLLTGRDGTILAGTDTTWPAEVAPAGAGFGLSTPQEIRRGGERWLIVARELPGGFGLLAGRSLAPVDATLAALRRGMAALMAALLVVAAAVGWLAARQVMGRIGRLNRLADQVAAGDLEARLPGPRSQDEFGLLETHMHHMLDRIASLNRATHRLSDTIAHEMRTPLNRIATRLSEIEGQEDKVDQLRGEMRGAIRIFDALLDISRAEADQGSGGGLVPVDLSALAGEIWELYEPLAEEKGLLPGADIAPGIFVLGDRTLISQMLANILDNAIKYCETGDRLRLSLAPGTLRPGSRHILEIADSGPGLPEGMGEEVFERFTRADRDRTRGIRGHGLGLALVRAIAMRHGAKLSLPAVPKGLTLRLEWQVLGTD